MAKQDPPARVEFALAEDHMHSQVPGSFGFRVS
jgi:hypothetical protein